MGGGDLNLKKSWHPSTLKNIERVWKAEQKHEVEQQKIEQLQRELEEERAREEIRTFAEDQGAVKKKDQRLDWMYQGPAAMVNREEYLLGRKIDKTLETLQQVEKGGKPSNEDSDVTSSVFSSQNLSGTATVDLANKIREDPLFSIMKKEKEERKNLLCNPVKMKQLQKLLEASLSEKKSKKHKKNKKKKHAGDDSDEEKSQKKRKKQNRSSSPNSEEEDRQSHVQKTDYAKKHSYSHQERSQEDRYRESDRRYERYYSSRSMEYKKSSGQPSHYRNRYSDQDHVQHYDNHKSNHNNRSKEDKKRYDAAEQERKLKEMQDNAKWRDNLLRKNTKRYQEEDEREEMMSRGDASDFIKPMLSKAAKSSTLENRVKQKIFSIQRSNHSMDKNFARRE